MAVKLVAIDLDDTLLNSKLEVSPQVKKTIFKVREKGILVTIATGRMYSSTLPYARQLEINVPLITYQGAMIKNSLTEETLLHHKLPLELAKDIVQVGYQKKLQTNVFIDDKLYIDQQNQEAEDYYRLSGVNYHEVGNLSDFMQQDPTKLIIIDYNEKGINNLQVELLERYGNKVYITRSKPYYLEFLNPLANKAKALEFLGRKHGILREEIMAIGDSYNDLEMIEYAGLGVVMGNARPEIKEKADYVTLGNEEDGVAEALEKFCLN